jgi:hypothetical protein
MENEKTETPTPTLTEFIDENHKLISTLAIFGALSAFANNIDDKFVARVLAFSFFTLSLLVYFELVTKFPYTTRGTLHWFSELFSFSMLAFCVAWFERYYPLLIVVLVLLCVMVPSIVVFGLFTLPIRKILTRLNWPKNERLRKVLPTFIAMIPTALVYFLVRHLIGSRMK